MMAPQKPKVPCPRPVVEVESDLARVLEEISQREAIMAKARNNGQFWMISMPALRRANAQEGLLGTSGASVRFDIQPLQDQQDAAWEQVRRLRLERELAYAVKKGVKRQQKVRQQDTRRAS